jgi:hypothetical protein
MFSRRFHDGLPEIASAAVSVDHTAIQRLGFEVGKELHLEAPVN